MKQLNIILFALVLSFITSHAIAQQEKNLKWDIAFSYGLATPVGSFSKVVPEASVLTYGETGKYFMFEKDGHSAAKNGQFLSLDLSYHFNKHWLASLVASQSKNTVDTKQVMDYLNSVFDPDFSSVTNNDYLVNSLSVGFGYQFYVRKFSFRLVPILGYAGISSPDYYFIWGNRYSYEVTCKENSFLLGINSGVSYQFGSKFYLGLKFDYNSAEFKYCVNLRTPGSSPFRKTDVINYRLLKTGLTLGIRL